MDDLKNGIQPNDFMKPFYCCFVFFAMLSPVSFSQKNDLRNFHLTGEVKSMIWTTECLDHSKTKEKACRDQHMNVWFDERGYKIVSDSENLGHDSIARTFNEKGQIIRWQDYRAKDTTICQYIYNDEGALTEEIWTYSKDIHGENGQIIKYDKQGRATSEEHQFADSTKRREYALTYKFDNKDSVIEIKKTDVKTHWFITTKYSYDEWAYIKEESVYDNKGEIITRHLYKNDAKGNHLEWTLEGTGRKGYFSVHHIAQYDEHNNCIKDKYENKEAKLKGRVTTKYEYDRKGNWTKETKTKNGKIESISTRALEYY
jgi:hypothetical protein